MKSGIYLIKNNINYKIYIGKKHSEETKLKMAESQKRRWNTNAN